MYRSYRINSELSSALQYISPYLFQMREYYAISGEMADSPADLGYGVKLNNEFGQWMADADLPDTPYISEIRIILLPTDFFIDPKISYLNQIGLLRVLLTALIHSLPRVAQQQLFSARK